MRQHVRTTSPTSLTRALGCAAMVLSVVSSGCHLTKPPPPTPLDVWQRTTTKPPASSTPASPDSSRAASTGKAPIANAPKGASAGAPPALSASARIRGQSGDGWSSATAGNDDSFKTPMVASDANQNRYLPPATGLYAPQSPPPGYPTQAPAGSLPPTTAYQPPATPPPAAGYGVPGNYATPPNAYGAGGNAAGSYASPSDFGGPSGYGVPGAYGSPNSYGASVAPGVTQPWTSNEAALAPGVYAGDPMAGINAPEIMVPGQYQPNVRVAPLDVYLQEGRTGRIVLGGSVNSDLGVAGQVIIEERNFDIRRFPTSWGDMWSGRAFRGNGENFRAELMPGSRVERYTVNWSTRNLLGYLPYSLSVGGFYYTRQFQDWTEQRLGGRAALGYEVTKDLSISSELRMEDVKIFDPRISGIQELDDALGSNDLYTARLRVAHDTRDNPFMSTEGALLELVYDQVFGEYDYPRGQVNYSRYFLVDERPDGSGRHTLAHSWKLGLTGSQTPIFENYFAGGYSTLRGFSFRGASPMVNGVEVGGELSFLGSLEYLFPLTADEMLRGVAFVDYGTVERDLEINAENFRVAPGVGLRVTVPALGPAPLAFDFAFPVAYADTDDRQVFSFFMGFTR